MAWVIMKSAGDEFSFTTVFVEGEVGYLYGYAQKQAETVTRAMKQMLSICQTCNKPHEKTCGENNEWCENCVPF